MDEERSNIKKTTASDNIELLPGMKKLVKVVHTRAPILIHKVTEARRR